MFSIIQSIRQELQSTLARNTGWMLLGQGCKLVMQALYFIVVARSLGPQNYGAFVGVVGLVGIVLPFASMGSGFVLIKNVARDEGQFRKSFGNALLTTFVSATILFGAVTLVARVMLKTVPIHLVLTVAAADLFSASVSDICGLSFVAFEQMKWTATLNVLFSAVRLLAAVVLAIVHAKPTASEWGALYFASTTLVALVAFATVSAKLGFPMFRVGRRGKELREGLYFSINQSAFTIYNDIDKAMLARLSTLEATGIYGAAYRLVDVSFTPMASVLVAAYPNFFRVGVDGMSATLRYVKPLLFRALGYTTFVAIALFFGARVVPLILGREYRLTTEALQWLAVLPLLKAVHSFLADALTGAGYQSLRSAITAGAAVFNVTINLWLIPAYSWRGAAWSSIATDALLASAIGTAAFILSRRLRPLPGSTEAFDARVEA